VASGFIVFDVFFLPGNKGARYNNYQVLSIRIQAGRLRFVENPVTGLWKSGQNLYAVN